MDCLEATAELTTCGASFVPSFGFKSFCSAGCRAEFVAVKNSERVAFVPTLEHIAAETARIRAGWSRREWLIRAGYSPHYGRVEVETVKVNDVEAVLEVSKA